MEKLESKKIKIKLKKFYKKIHEHIKKNIKEKKRKIIIKTIIGDNRLYWNERKNKQECGKW